ncbi:MAG: hypothetical protein HY695_16585 [Deltaproteobacteria bacterium]|nr:hypothetical protein [Deltaproteobacteria bacterium]
MNEQNPFNIPAEELTEAERSLLQASGAIISHPFIAPASGLYTWQSPIIFRTPTPISGPSPSPVAEPTQGAESEALSLLRYRREELRLDVDGRYPQMTASGTISGPIASRIHWIAKLIATSPISWTGSIWYKDTGGAAFPYTTVQIQATRSWIPGQRTVVVTFSGGGGPNRVRTLRFASPYFHPVNLEFDCAEGEPAALSVNTCAHPNRPASLPCEDLSVQTVFQRAGFEVTTSPGGPVPVTGAGPNTKWSDQEMHDAMQTYWSRFANKAQWAFWVFFASLHEMGTSLGGIMFDDIGPNHRQGTAIFNDSFVATPPAGDVSPAAWVQRMIFWTACHEMGHCFNLAHSWQKSLGTPWIPLADEPEARSFMNYPYRVAGGQTAFFGDFQYLFSDAELLLMRHAPERFVQMANADWFDHHGFQGANVSPEPSLKLELRANRETTLFEFLEPVTLELKLTNISSQVCLVDENVLSSADTMTVIIKKEGKPARRLLPYVQYCWLPKKRVLTPGAATYESLFISAGRNGWDLAEPGRYTIQVALHLEGEDIVSNPLPLRVAPPRGYDEELIAQDFFTDDVGRIIALDGSYFLEKGNDVLRNTVESLADRRVAIHARVALGRVLMQDYKQLVAESVNGRRGLAVRLRSAQLETAKQHLSAALIDKPEEAMMSLGHIDYRWYEERLADCMVQRGDVNEAMKIQQQLYQVMSARRVNGRGIAEAVLQKIKERRDSYGRPEMREPARAGAWLFEESIETVH